MILIFQKWKKGTAKVSAAMDKIFFFFLCRKYTWGHWALHMTNTLTMNWLGLFSASYLTLSVRSTNVSILKAVCVWRVEVFTGTPSYILYVYIWYMFIHWHSAVMRHVSATLQTAERSSCFIFSTKVIRSRNRWHCHWWSQLLSGCYFSTSSAKHHPDTDISITHSEWDASMTKSHCLESTMHHV